MTIDRSKIDEVFKERLYGYEVVPPYDVWEKVRLRNQKQKKARNRRIIFRMAASLALLIGLGILFLTQKESIHDSGQTALNQQDNQSFENVIETPPSQPSTPVPNDTKDNNSEKITNGFLSENDNSNTVNENQESRDQRTKRPSFSRKRKTEILDEKKSLIAGITPGQEPGQKLAEPGFDNNALPNDDFPEPGSENFADNKKMPETTHFSLKAAMSPVMSYRRVKNEVSRAEYNTSESKLFAYSGGLNFGYNVSNRLSIYSGFYYSQVGQTVSKIRLGSRDFAQYGEEVFVKLNNSLGQVEVAPEKLLSVKPPENLENIVSGRSLLKFSYKLDASVIQRFEYVKIPLMLEYTMIDRKIDLNLIGGLNSNFLVNQGVYLKEQTGDTRLIGNTSNIRQFNYSGSMGLGMEYNLTKQVNMYLEPHMDYFLNPVNYSETKTYPYSFAVYTGLSITF